jgi:hypothetical protein
MKPYIYSILICIVCVICNSCNSSPTGLGEEIPDSVDMISFFTKNPKWTKYEYRNDSLSFSRREKFWSPLDLNVPIYFANDRINNCLWRVQQDSTCYRIFPDTLVSLNKKIMSKSVRNIDWYDMETSSQTIMTRIISTTYTYETSRSVTFVINIKEFVKGKEISNNNNYYWLRR